jgi:cobyrinic acid a,c-diamide synthase
MTGLLAIDLEMKKKPAGHGYTTLKVSKENPYFETGTEIIGHEFHYSSPIELDESIPFCMDVETGTGISNKKDGLLFKNCFAGYTHIHADGVKNWAPLFIKAASKYNEEKTSENFKIAI